MAVSLSISITQNSQSVTNNTSNVTVVLTAHWTQGSYNQYQKPGWLKIDGTTYDFTHNFNWNATTTGSEELFRKTVDVSHGTDGSKTLTCSASYTTGVSSGTVTTSASKTLTTIARESTIEAGWANLGETQTLFITQQSSSFTHSIKYKCGTKSGYIKADGSLSTTEVKHNGTNVKWTPPISFAEENTTGDRLTCTFTLTTYSGSTQIGNKRECAVTLVIPTKGFLPTISTAISDSTDCFKTYGSYVQGHSALNVVITGEGSYGSTIDESEGYEVYFESKSYFEKSATTDVISGSGTLNIVTYVEDSRSRKVADYNSIEVLPYSAPKITDLSVKRCKKDENSKTDDCLAVTFSAEITPLNNKNSASYSIQYKKTSETNYCDPVSLSGYGYTAANGTYVFEADTASSYDVLLIVEDDFPDLKATKPAVGSSVKKTWSMYKNGNGFAFGKVAEVENALEVAPEWDVVVGGNLTVGGKSVTDGLLSTIGAYLSVTEDNIDSITEQGLYSVDMASDTRWVQMAVFRTTWAVMQVQFSYNGAMRSRMRWGGNWSAWVYDGVTSAEKLKQLCSDGAGNSSPSYVVGFNADYKSGGYTSMANLRKAIGALPVGDGGTDVNLNNFTTNGVYDIVINASALSSCNLPSEVVSMGHITWATLTVFGTYNTRLTQFLTLPFAHHQRSYIRYKHDSSWSLWSPVSGQGPYNRPIWETLIYVGSLPNATTKSVSIGLANGHVIGFHIIGRGSSSGYCRVFPTSASSSDVVSVWLQNGTVNIKTTTDWSEYQNCYLVLRYTELAWY